MVAIDIKTKACPFCAETIQEAAIKCRFCGEFLDKPPRPKTKWYFNSSTVVIAILCVGPVALPLVWFNPKYKMNTKIIVSVVVVIVSILLYYLTKNMYTNMMQQLNQLGM